LLSRDILTIISSMMKIIAHRGASGYEPENTLAAFRKAIQLGADMLEFDVHALPSGEVVLIHDHRINRTTNGIGYVLQHSFDELRSLDAGSGELIPTLQEVLDLVGRQIRVNIELKGPRSASGVAKIIGTYLSLGWQPSDFLVSSFDHHELVEFHRLVPSVDIAALNDAIPLHYAAFAEELQAVAICPSDEFVSERYVEDAHRRSLQVFVWTVNDPEEVERMCMIGVDGIFTNFPDTARVTANNFIRAARRSPHRADSANVVHRRDRLSPDTV
jgi:glycerophosphoryl diester phosphodiesterase